jgi:hypothetical protein
VLEALRQGRSEDDPSNISRGLDQAKLAITTSISLLEYQSKVNEAASLYLKISRSLGRSLNRVLSASSSGSGHGSQSNPDGYYPSLQNQGLPYGRLEQQSVMQSQLPNAFSVELSGSQPSSDGEPFKYFTLSGKQKPELYGAEAAEALSYSHASGIPNWKASEFSIDESIDPSLLEPGQDFPQQ